MQLIDCELHWRFKHLRAHVEYKTRLNNTSRHVCDLFEHGFKILVDLFRCSVAIRTEKPGAMSELGAVSEKHCRQVMLFLPQRGFILLSVTSRDACMYYSNEACGIDFRFALSLNSLKEHTACSRPQDKPPQHINTNKTRH